LIERPVQHPDGHSSFEENMMRERGYASLAENTEQHTMLASQVRGSSKGFAMAKPSTVPRRPKVRAASAAELV
jgi:hemerythrin